MFFCLYLQSQNHTFVTTEHAFIRMKESENPISPAQKSTLWGRFKTWLQSLSFRTGVIVLACCIPFYILSFAQMLLPISAAAKGVLWTVLFGLAKTCQYGGLTILGVEGYNRVKSWIRRRRGNK